MSTASCGEAGAARTLGCTALATVAVSADDSQQQANRVHACLRCKLCRSWSHPGRRLGGGRVRVPQCRGQHMSGAVCATRQMHAPAPRVTQLPDCRSSRASRLPTCLPCGVLLEGSALLPALQMRMSSWQPRILLSAPVIFQLPVRPMARSARSANGKRQQSGQAVSELSAQLDKQLAVSGAAGTSSEASR